jgi:D-glycero-alpha-D-manno-heptose-7-phosphate kinase
MIISRTPFRISFFGGGTDYPAWYEEHGGSVISTTINKYCYITARYLPPFFEYKHRIRYFKKEETRTIDDIEHPSVRETAKYLGIDQGIEIVHSGDLPAQSGLGTSSTFTVGLLNSLHGLRNYMPTKRELALDAIHIEQKLIKESVGSQDQTAAAFGGLNRITFSKARTIEVDPIIISKERTVDLQDSLLLCFTGFARTASVIAEKKIAAISQRQSVLTEMMQLCDEAFKVLASPTASLEEFGKLLHIQWELKKSLSESVSNNDIDTIYETGMKAGALGGKLLGAGSGGFILFFAPKTLHQKIKDSLIGKVFVPIRFEFTGSKIIYFSHD